MRTSSRTPMRDLLAPARRSFPSSHHNPHTSPQTSYRRNAVSKSTGPQHSPQTSYHISANVIPYPDTGPPRTRTPFFPFLTPQSSYLAPIVIPQKCGIQEHRTIASVTQDKIIHPKTYLTGFRIKCGMTPWQHSTQYHSKT